MLRTDENESDAMSSRSSRSSSIESEEDIFINVPIPMHDVHTALGNGSGNGNDMNGPVGVGTKPSAGAIRTVRMTRGEYREYFAKNKEGEFTCTQPRTSGEWKDVLRGRLEDERSQDVGEQGHLRARNPVVKEQIGYLDRLRGME